MYRRPSLGVLITYYNEGELFRACLDSALALSDGPDEILVYDDASEEVPATDFLPRDPRIRLIRGERNQGPAYGRNVLLRVSRSEYVHCHDADDLFLPDWARAVREEIAKEPQPDLIVHDLMATRHGLAADNAVIRLYEMYDQPYAGDLVAFAISRAFLPSGVICRRELALTIGGYRTRDLLSHREDYDFGVRIAFHATNWRAILRPLAVRSLRDSSLSATSSRDGFVAGMTSIELLSSDLPLHYQQALSETAASWASHLFGMGAVREAFALCRLARSLGRPRFIGRPPGYRVLAAIANQETAECFGWLYRGLLPIRVRQALRPRRPTHSAMGPLASTEHEAA